MINETILAIIIAFVISTVLYPIVIPFLHGLKFGQQMRGDGSRTHLKKQGTPTMGDLIILESIITTSILYIRDYLKVILILLVAVGPGIIDFPNDYIKIVIEHPEGLNPKQKILGQVIMTGILTYYLMNSPEVGTQILIPFAGGFRDGYYLNLGISFIPFVFAAILGTDNGANLTDGLDGLRTSVTVLVATFLTIITVGENSGISPITGVVVGSLLGFLLFNAYLAKVFMGGTGSLALGDFVPANVFMMNIPLFMPLIGLIYLVEVLSVVTQVTCFKKTDGKRVFKMASTHHHFELCGWSETRIVVALSIITAILCLTVYLGLQHDKEKRNMGQNQRVLVAGIGIDGTAVACLLLGMGGEVILYDDNTELDPDTLKGNFGEGVSISVFLGDLKRTNLLGAEVCVISSDISLGTPFVNVLDEARIPTWNEIQLAHQCAKGELAVITGINGKAITMTLMGKIMKAHHENVLVVGNTGVSHTQVALETEDDSIIVTGVSNFQLETIMGLRPDVSAILNITPDRLNRHHTVECYIEVKESVARNQIEAGTCMLNYDDEVLRGFGESEKLKVKPVSSNSRQKLEEGYYLDGDLIAYRHEGKAPPVIDVHELHLLGRHNFKNVMAVVAVSMAMGVPLEKIQGVLRTFTAMEHRTEFVLERIGVKYYNDSEETNPDVIIQAINAMLGPILPTAGGCDKQPEYDEQVEALEGKVKYLMLIGQTRDEIAECAKAHGLMETIYAEDMPEAMHVCASHVNTGDCILLSPICANQGMFKNYKERGDVFGECVRNL